MKKSLQEVCQYIKDAVTVPDVWAKANLPGTPGSSCKNPLRDDRKPSMSIYDGGTRWKDHATGEGGSSIDFAMLAWECDLREAVELLAPLAGIDLDSDDPSPPRARQAVKPIARKFDPSRGKPKFPSDLRRATRPEIDTIANGRHVTPESVRIAGLKGRLRVGTICGQLSWILLSQRCSEARRIDGKIYPAFRSLPERKAHCLGGSKKDFPIGLDKRADGYLAVEGGPDYLAAWHFLFLHARKTKPSLRKGNPVLVPLAFLGRKQGVAPEARPFLEGKRIRIFPHIDDDGGGKESAILWAEKFTKLGSGPVDFFNLEGLHRTGGEPITDLNDCTTIHPDDAHNLENLLPTK